eukprot:20856-Eustigmatos_ZCMA.PRE.1
MSLLACASPLAFLPSELPTVPASDSTESGSGVSTHGETGVKRGGRDYAVNGRVEPSANKS